MSTSLAIDISLYISVATRGVSEKLILSDRMKSRRALRAAGAVIGTRCLY